MVSNSTPADRLSVQHHWSAAAVLLACSASLSACVSARQVSAPPAATAPAPPAPRPAHTPEVADFARSLVGTPYHYGRNTPASCFDCSGLIVYVMALQDIAMPRTVSEQYQVGSHVQWNRLRDGDLVFFTTTGRGATHVGIIVDAAHQQFVHAPTNGSTVRVDSLLSDYWRKRWIGTRRVL